MRRAGTGSLGTCDLGDGHSASWSGGAVLWSTAALPRYEVAIGNFSEDTLWYQPDDDAEAPSAANVIVGVGVRDTLRAFLVSVEAAAPAVCCWCVYGGV
jgi:hypothetical protein